MALQRVQFELPEEKMKGIEQLMLDTGIKTNKELVSNAITLLLWAVREVQRGRSIASIDEATGRFKEVTTPALEFAAKAAEVKVG